MTTDTAAVAAALVSDAEGMTFEEWIAPETDDPWRGLAADILLALRSSGFRVVPAAELKKCAWCGHPPMCHKGTAGECVAEEASR